MAGPLLPWLLRFGHTCRRLDGPKAHPKCVPLPAVTGQPGSDRCSSWLVPVPLMSQRTGGHGQPCWVTITKENWDALPRTHPGALPGNE